LSEFTPERTVFNAMKTKTKHAGDSLKRARFGKVGLHHAR